MIALLPFAVPIGLAAFAIYAWKRGANSSKEDDMPTSDTSRVDIDVLDSIGWPYFFGKGSPATPWSDGPNGVDCSGYAQMVLVKLGKLSAKASDRGASALADDSDAVAIGSQRPGDMAYYPGHVMIVASEPDSTGHSMVIGASGGGRTTFGNDSNAKIKLFSSALYRDDFVTYMRLK